MSWTNNSPHRQKSQSRLKKKWKNWHDIDAWMFVDVETCVHTGVRRYLEFSATDIWEGKKIVVWKTADYTPTIVIGSIYDIFNDNYEQWNMDLNELIMPLIFRQCLPFSQTFNICLKKSKVVSILRLSTSAIYNSITPYECKYATDRC